MTTSKNASFGSGSRGPSTTQNIPFLWHGMICDEMWNNVSLYGPSREIERFMELCLVPTPPGGRDDSETMIDFNRIIPLSAAYVRSNRSAASIWGTSYNSWNFKMNRQDGNTLHIKFDTLANFPEPILERLAELFPSVAFDCGCIADDDRSMGYGWFNTPVGGKDFFDGYRVPKNYWKKSRGRRGPKSAAKHAELVAELRARLSMASNRDQGDKYEDDDDVPF